MNREERQIYSRLSRRGFMGATAGATLAALAGGEPLFGQTSKTNATADSVIILWMAGGMAQTETFDPKRYTPYSAGLKSDQVKRLKDLETENSRLRRAIADLTLDKQILTEAARGNY